MGRRKKSKIKREKVAMAVTKRVGDGGGGGGGGWVEGDKQAQRCFQAYGITTTNNKNVNQFVLFCFGYMFVSLLH